MKHSVEEYNAKPFEITLRLRNNLLKSRRLGLDLSSRKMAEAAGVRLSTYYDLEGLRRSPVGPDGQWTTAAMAVAIFLKVPPDDLWPDCVMAITKPVVISTVESDELKHLAGYQQELLLSASAPNPEDACADHERSRMIRMVLRSLPPRDQCILRMYFLEDKTTDEIARDFEVCRARVQQVIDRALKRLRHPSRARYLKECLGSSKLSDGESQ